MPYKFNPFTGSFDLFNDGNFSGDITLDGGGAYTTTLQVITATADRVISFPDATGTLALVAGSSGQLIYNSAGANAGTPTLTYDGSILTSTGRFINSYNAAGIASAPAKAFTGTWFTGGTATTTKPHVLIEPSGTTSGAWSTSGTGLGVNAASGFAGNLLDLQVGGASKFSVDNAGVFYNSGKKIVELFGNQTLIYSGFNVPVAALGTGGTQLGAALYYGFTPGTASQTADVRLYRDAAGILAQRNGTDAQTYRLYNTYTDASNYERAKLSWNSNVFEIGTEGAGTGLGRPLTLQTSGIDRVTLGAGNGLTVHGSVSQAFIDCTTYFASTTANGSRALAGNGFAVGSAFTYSFSSTTGANGTPDVALARNQAGVVAITNGSTGTGYLKQTPVAVSALPAAATVGAGTRGFVSDSTVAASGNFGATVAGGGSNNVPVFSDGTNWLIG